MPKLNQNTRRVYEHARSIAYECDEAAGYCGNGTVICTGDGTFHHAADHGEQWRNEGTCKKCSKSNNLAYIKRLIDRLRAISRIRPLITDTQTKDEGRRSNGSAVRAHTNGQTDRRTDATKCVISLASRLIKIWRLNGDLTSFVLVGDSRRVI